MTTEFKFDDDIPIPPINLPRFPELRQMRVGQSVRYPLTDYKALISKCSKLKRRYGIQFTVRQVFEDGPGAWCRVWRIE